MRSSKFAVAAFLGTLSFAAASRSEASGSYSLGLLAAVPQSGEAQFFSEYWGGLHHSDPGTHVVRLPLPLTNPSSTAPAAQTVGSPTIFGVLDNTLANVCLSINSLDPYANTFWATANSCAQIPGLPFSGSFEMMIQNLYVPASGHAQALVSMQGSSRASTFTWTN